MSTRRDMIDHLELIRAYSTAVQSPDPAPVLSDLVNTTGLVEIAVFLDEKYPDINEVRESLLRGKAAGVRHVIPGTARHTLALAEDLGLDVLVAGLPTAAPPRKFGSWKAIQKRLHKKLYYKVKPEWLDDETVSASNWRKEWRDWCLVARCDHTLVFRRPDANSGAAIAEKVKEYPHLEERVHVFESEVKQKKYTKGRAAE